MPLKRIIRERHLTPAEVEKYDTVRRQVADDLPEIIARRNQISTT
jgi:hypothetical protein